MADKLGLLNQWMFGNWAERDTINRNAETLSNVETTVADLRKLVERQAKEITQLRAMFMGMVEVLHGRGQLDEAELESAVKAAWTKLSPPPAESKPSQSGPYRDTPSSAPADEPTNNEIAEAKALMKQAQDHQFNRQFEEARAIYQQVFERYGNTKQAVVARQQLDNLRNA